MCRLQRIHSLTLSLATSSYHRILLKHTHVSRNSQLFKSVMNILLFFDMAALQVCTLWPESGIAGTTSGVNGPVAQSVYLDTDMPLSRVCSNITLMLLVHIRTMCELGPITPQRLVKHALIYSTACKNHLPSHIVFSSTILNANFF